MREIITIHVGQGGVQIGNSIWELFGKENNLFNDGTLKEQNESESVDRDNTMFYESLEGKYTPRAVFADLDSDIGDEVRVGELGKLFNQEQILNWNENAGDIFARGRYAVGKKLIKQCLDQIRKTANQGGNLQGFIVTHSISGGTGSGFGSYILENLSDQYPKKLNLCGTVFPSPNMATSVVEPYNYVLSSETLRSFSDLTLGISNEALYRIGNDHLGIPSPNYLNLNRIIAQLLSSVTISMRYNGNPNTDLTALKTNLVPYNNIHYVLPSMAPLIPSYTQHKLNRSNEELTVDCFERSAVMAKCDPLFGKYIAGYLQYRGQVLPKDVFSSIAAIKSSRSIQFVDWCPTGFKSSLSHCKVKESGGEELGGYLKSGTMLANSTCLGEIFSPLSHKFDMLYYKRAFVHWLIDDMSEYEFGYRREDLAHLEKDYEEIAVDNSDLSSSY